MSAPPAGARLGRIYADPAGRYVSWLGPDDVAGVRFFETRIQCVLRPGEELPADNPRFLVELAAQEILGTAAVPPPYRAWAARALRSIEADILEYRRSDGCGGNSCLGCDTPGCGG